MLESGDNGVKLEGAQNIWDEFLVMGNKVGVLGFFLLITCKYIESA